MLSANKFYPITEYYFRDKSAVDLRPGNSVIANTDQPINGIHIFKWGVNSFLVIETHAGQIIRFPSTALVEGAVYYIKINKIMEAGPSSKETIIMGISSY